ncbi:MAG: rod shape-determining protein MreC [Thermoanaerobaculia bacterium]
MGARRSTLALVVLLLVQLVVLAVQDDATAQASPARRALLRVVAPFAGAVSSVRGALAGGVNTVRHWGGLRRENLRLREELADLELRLLRLYGLEGDVRRLQGAVEYERHAARPVALADVIYSDTRGLLRSLVIRLASGEAQYNQPVVVPAGIVGRVINATGPWARVQLVTDREAWVGAMVERTRRQGLVSGGAEGGLELVEIPLQEDIRPGDVVVTSGTDGIYPRGLPVGTVRRVEPGGELFHQVELDPAVDPEQLTQVYLLPARGWPDELERTEP